MRGGQNPALGTESREHFRSEILREREVWNHKASLRRIYQEWFARVERYLPDQGPVVELGCGAGGFKQRRPDIITTDVVASPWVDQVADATALPFRDGALGALVAFDVLHHVPRPLTLLREAARVLRPGGRLIFFEPAITPWSRLIWGLFHREPVDLSYNPFNGEPVEPRLYFANTALPSLLFERYRERLERELPELKIETLAYSDFLVYPLTGGFSSFCLLPGFAVAPLYRLECALLRPTARWLTAMRLLAVLRKG